MLARVFLIIVILLALFATATTASPVRVRAMDGVEMAPTIGADDAYLVVDAAIVEVGDIVVIWSPEAGSLETRRVVERTEAGYHTKGDANDETDQAAGVSPIPRSGIVGEVATVNGRPIVLPGIGGVAAFVDEWRLLLLGLVALLAGVVVIRGRQGRRRPLRDRPVWRMRDVAGVLFVGLLLVSLAMTPLMAASFQVTFLATADGGETRYAVPVDEPVTRSIEVPVARAPFTQLIVESDGMTVERWERTGSSLVVTTTIPPAAAAGPRPATLSVFPYPAVLPRPILEALHTAHPIVAILGSVATVLGPPTVGYLLFVDGDRPIRSHRVRRRLRQLRRARR